MENMAKACQALVKKGKAERVLGETIYFKGKVNRTKLAEVERSYDEAFRKRWLEDDAKEREAQKKFHDFVITY